MSFSGRLGAADGRIPRMLPPISVILFLMFFLFMLLHGSWLLIDGDTGWHIINGERTLATHAFPHAYPYYYTMSGAHWQDFEWLSEVLMALFYKAMGLNGVVLLTISVITLTIVSLYRFMLHRGVNPVSAAIFTILAAMVTAIHWLARPHIFSFPMTLAFFAILDTYQRGGKDRLLLLPLLTILWVNLHGGYILGIFFIAVYAGGNQLLSVISTGDRRGYRTKAVKLWLILALCVAAACINPYGTGLLTLPFRLVGNKFLVNHIWEFQSPNFHYELPAELMLLVSGAIFVIAEKKPDLFEGAIILLLAHMSLFAMRFLPLFALVVTPIAAARLEDALSRIRAGARDSKILERMGQRLKKAGENMAALEMRPAWRLPIIACLAITFAIAANGGKVMNTKVMNMRFNTKVVPVNAVNFVLDNNIKGNMLNDFGWGGYIDYRAYPRYKVFLDGNWYGLPMMRDYLKMMDGRSGYEKLLEKYNVNWVIVYPREPIVHVLLATGKWKMVYKDKTAVVILKDVPENQEIIRKYII